MPYFYCIRSLEFLWIIRRCLSFLLLSRFVCFGGLVLFACLGFGWHDRVQIFKRSHEIYGL
jgi:hypothetical protein